MSHQAISRIITGTILLAIGTMSLLGVLNIIELGALIDNYWPLAIILAGGLVLLNSWRSWPVALFLVALGGAYQLREIGVIDIEPWQLIWPLVLIFIGLSVVFGRSYSGTRASKAERDDISAIMSGATVNNSSKMFKQSNATAIMGGARLDLREAEFDENALIDIFTFWGGIEIIVPQNVIIRNKITNIMGGTEDKTQQKTSKNSAVLTVTGTVIMSGVSIRNTPSDN